MNPFCVVALLVASVSSAQLQSPVRTVGPAGEFTTVHAALAAASDGDVLLVEPGRYLTATPLVIDRPLSIVADGGPVLLTARVIVTGIPAGASVYLRGLVFENQTRAIKLLDNPGHVWMESCSIHTQFSSLGEPEGLIVEDCADVVLLGTEVRGAEGFLEGFLVGHGLAVTRSTVHAFDCRFEGGFSTDLGRDSLDAGHGIHVADGASTILLSGSTATGGAGSCSFPHCDGLPGDGLHNSGGAVYVTDSALVPGTAPATGCGCSALAASGGFAPLTGSPVRVSSDAPRREGESLTLTFEGPPSVPVWYAASLSSRGQLLPQLRGSSLIGPLLVSRFAGTLGATGRIDVPLPVPPIVAPGSGIRLFVQAFSSGPAVLGDGSLVLLLDDSL